MQYSYRQTASDLSRPLVQQCRGLILNQRDWSIVAYPYAKFFNYGESRAADVDWSTATVTEKVDGSLAILYWYQQWHVASQTRPDGSGVLQSGQTFAEHFWQLFHENRYRLPKEKHFTYIFELFTSEQPIVVKPEKNELWFHGSTFVNLLRRAQQPNA